MSHVHQLVYICEVQYTYLFLFSTTSSGVTYTYVHILLETLSALLTKPLLVLSSMCTVHLQLPLIVAFCVHCRIWLIVFDSVMVSFFVTGFKYLYI